MPFSCHFLAIFLPFPRHFRLIFVFHSSDGTARAAGQGRASEALLALVRCVDEARGLLLLRIFVAPVYAANLTEADAALLICDHFGCAPAVAITAVDDIEGGSMALVAWLVEEPQRVNDED